MNNMQFNPNMGAYPYGTAPNNYTPNRFNAFAPPVNSMVNNSITWVQGIEGAKAYQIAPNSNVILMDSDNEGIFYIKVSDSVGMCNLRVFSYTETTNQPATTESAPNIDMSEYVTKSELDEILKNIKGGKANGKQSVPANDAKRTISE